MGVFSWIIKFDRTRSRIQRLNKLKGIQRLFATAELGADAGQYVGTEAARYQMETGIAGQTGIGGGPWNPKGVEQEMQWLSSGRF